MPRTMRAKYLSEQSLEEAAYRADFEVVDRYQAFSTELLRLSLLGIAGYGFLLSQIVFRADGQAVFLERLDNSKWLLAMGLASLGLSAGTALLHRFSSTDCTTHHIRFLRLHHSAERLPDGSAERKTRMSEAEAERESLERDLDRCKWSLLTSAVALCLGVLAVSVTFARTLF